MGSEANLEDLGLVRPGASTKRLYRGDIPDSDFVPITRVILTGFMGAGKSSIGRLLAVHLGWSFCDADEHLVREHGMSIEAIFEQVGESAFRTLEEQNIAQLLNGEQAVIALGGGALESEKTRDLVLGSIGTYVVFLDAPLEVAIDRCKRQPGGAVRPVLVSLDRTALAERYRQRLQHYSKAHRTLDTATGSPAELAQSLAEQLRRDSLLSA